MNNPNQNPNCDNYRCISNAGEVRVLPISGEGNAILCHSCLLHEMEFRRGRNRELGGASQFELPAWEGLQIYENK